MMRGTISEVTTSSFNKFALSIISIFFICVSFFRVVSITPTVTTDSIYYFAAAQNGLFIPFGNPGYLSHFPPLYSIVLSLPLSLGLDILISAKVLNIFFLCGSGALIFFTIRQFLDFHGAMVATALAVALLLPQFCYVLSEPLFIFLSLMGLFFLSFGKSRYAGLSLAAAVLTRYAGAALLPAGVAILLLRKRFREAIFFTIIFLLPIIAWVSFNIANGEEPANRMVVFHLPPFSKILSLLMIIVFFVLIWGLNRKNEILSSFSIFGASYGGILLLSLTFFDAYTPLDGRILSPLVASVIVIAFRYFNRLSQFVIILFLVCYLQIKFSPIAGYESASWRESQLISEVRKFDERTTIYSNGADAIYFLTGRSARGLPLKYDPVSLSKYDNYSNEIREMHGTVVFFNALAWRAYFPKLDELSSDCKQFMDGSICNLP